MTSSRRFISIMWKCLSGCSLYIFFLSSFRIGGSVSLFLCYSLTITLSSSPTTIHFPSFCFDGYSLGLMDGASYICIFMYTGFHKKKIGKLKCVCATRIYAVCVLVRCAYIQSLWQFDRFICCITHVLSIHNSCPKNFVKEIEKVSQKKTERRGVEERETKIIVIKTS